MLASSTSSSSSSSRCDDDFITKSTASNDGNDPWRHLVNDDWNRDTENIPKIVASSRQWQYYQLGKQKVQPVIDNNVAVERASSTAAGACIYSKELVTQEDECKQKMAGKKERKRKEIVLDTRRTSIQSSQWIHSKKSRESLFTEKITTQNTSTRRQRQHCNTTAIISTMDNSAAAAAAAADITNARDWVTTHSCTVKAATRNDGMCSSLSKKNDQETFAASTDISTATIITPASTYKRNNTVSEKHPHGTNKIPTTPSFQPIAKSWERSLTQTHITGYWSTGTSKSSSRNHK